MSGNNELWQVLWQQGPYPTKAVFKKTTQAVVKEESKFEPLNLIDWIYVLFLFKQKHMYLHIYEELINPLK